jgi:predicted cupin superfamily sugar epimerase
MSATAAEIIAALGLAPHSEGGFFRETYRSTAQIETDRGRRCAATAILFLVTAATPSRFHRLRADELWLFQGGGLLELVRLSGRDRAAKQVLLGGEPPTLPQALVPAGDWQAAHLADGREGAWALVSCLVTPGFEAADLEIGGRDDLLRDYPAAHDLILLLT